MFLCTIFIWPCDLDFRPFDLGGVWWIKLNTHTTHIPIFSIRSWVICDSISSHYDHMERSLRMRRVMWPITGWQKWFTFLKSLTQFKYSLCHFQGAKTKIKSQIAFSHCERYKVYCTCTVSCYLCLWGCLRNDLYCVRWGVKLYSLTPPKPNVTIFDRDLSLQYTTFTGLRWRLRVVNIEASPC